MRPNTCSVANRKGGPKGSEAGVSLSARRRIQLILVSAGDRKWAASSRPSSSNAERVMRPCLVMWALLSSVSTSQAAASARNASWRPVSGSPRIRCSAKRRRAASTAAGSRSASVAPGTSSPDQSSFCPSWAHSRASLSG